jgi:hypothetical protein
VLLRSRLYIESFKGSRYLADRTELLTWSEWWQMKNAILETGLIQAKTRDIRPFRFQFEHVPGDKFERVIILLVVIDTDRNSELDRIHWTTLFGLLRCIEECGN